MTGIMAFLFGELWTRRKKSIILGVIVGGIVSWLLIEASSSLLWSIRSASPTPTGLLNLAIAQFYSYLVSAFVICSFTYAIHNYLAEQGPQGIVLAILRMTRRDMFETPGIAADHDLILLKNFGVAIFRGFWRFIGLVFMAVISLVLYLPGVPVGIITYGFIVTRARTLIFTFAAILTKQDLATYEKLWTLVNSGLHAVRQSQAALAILVALSIVVLSSLFDVVATGEEKNLRGGLRDILKRSMWNLAQNLNLPAKAGRSAYLLSSVLFSDRRTVSMDIPIISETKLYEALQEQLGNGGKKCVTMRIPMHPREMIKLLSELPKDMTDQIILTIKNETFAGSRLIVRIFMKLQPVLSSFQFSEKAIQKQVSKLEKRMAKFEKSAKETILMCSVAEDGISAYALVEVPPPNHRTRIIRLLWCSDFHVKEALVKAVEFH